MASLLVWHHFRCLSKRLATQDCLKDCRWNCRDAPAPVFSWYGWNLCWLSLTFIMDWRVLWKCYCAGDKQGSLLEMLEGDGQDEQSWSYDIAKSYLLSKLREDGLQHRHLVRYPETIGRNKQLGLLTCKVFFTNAGLGYQLGRCSPDHWRGWIDCVASGWLDLSKVADSPIRGLTCGKSKKGAQYFDIHDLLCRDFWHILRSIPIDNTLPLWIYKTS